ncbi:hypothetical protein RD2015_1111 [Roseateles depolymerans]|uniref:Uncharacterized protein n=1 Tax=Roseateles depolymerans TaxID=76731 RepID=A0A0U3MUN4_9BURK|nr:hypothetical protein RD2015_1111 [Roseateles depolymerans]
MIEPLQAKKVFRFKVERTKLKEVNCCGWVAVTYRNVGIASINSHNVLNFRLCWDKWNRKAPNLPRFLSRRDMQGG